jgi:hypothetical protein
MLPTHQITEQGPLLLFSQIVTYYEPVEGIKEMGTLTCRSKRWERWGHSPVDRVEQAHVNNPR